MIDIDIRPSRQRQLPAKISGIVILTRDIIGHREANASGQDCKLNVYFPIIDVIYSKMKSCLSDTNLSLISQ